jgi:tetratricopeptide (TPR) repeat protein
MISNLLFIPVRYYSLALLCLGVLSLGACAQQTKLEQTKAVVLQGAPNSNNVQEEITKPEYKDFRPETLYSLMLAEVALQRQMPELALSYYRREAENTRDPGIIRRGLELSTWLEVHQVSLELITLWQEVEPNNPKAHQIMAQQQLYFGLIKGSLKSIERVFELGAEFNFDYFNQLTSKLNEAEGLEVLRKLETLSQKYPKNSQLWLSRSYLYALLDQRQSALDASAKAIKLDKDDSRPVVVHAELRFNYNDHQAGLKEMEKGLKRFPDSKQLNLLYTQSLLKLAKNKKAEDQIYQIVDRFPDEYEYRYQLALMSGDFKLNHVAKDLLQQGLQDSYRKEESYIYLSRIAENENNYDEAIDYLKNIKPGVGFLEARLQIAYLLNDQGKSEQAIASLQEARFLEGESKSAFYHAEADLLAQIGREQEALKVFTQAIQEYPESIQLRYARSMLAERVGNLKLTESDLLFVIEREPRNAMALNALGYTLTNKTNRHKEALKYIEKAYEISPQDPAIVDSMGWVYYRLGDYPKAISFLEQAIALQADHEIAAHLGEVLWVSGLETEAKRVWDEALAKQADSEALKSVMAKFLNK